ncbi:hypothetical protein TTHERM_00802440 (macronuclear) [Tetrahymena thermophila SB210]|uniref:Uncharacterized protein n=1 Tax=Tetrahymena thermophila (strain SB210) TaxID=312017 RepID=Q235F7_TETTS|nr:hypothetical protein TTHERM_00802440 [Tetrahymena thermophila SB210]EAR92146.2 hypothetical protein TTHERM_00802440 [Tetrahymena thermophila SB210]|eukprot:XP_001012391.2 hypothetical protein TTHERM_00802440 [Tetrahymena thermophila SB210]
MTSIIENGFIRTNNHQSSSHLSSLQYSSSNFKSYDNFNSQSFFANLGVSPQDYTMTYADLEQTLNKYKRGNPSLINQEFKYKITTRHIIQKQDLQNTFKTSTNQQQSSNIKSERLEYEIGRMKTEEDEDINKILKVQQQILDIKKEFEEIKKNNNNKPFSNNDSSSFFQNYQGLSNSKSPKDNTKFFNAPAIEAQNLNYQFKQENINTPNFTIPNTLDTNYLAPTSIQKKSFQFENPQTTINQGTTNYTTYLTESFTPPPTRYAFIVDQFGSDQQSNEKMNTSSLTSLATSQNVFRSSTIKKEDPLNTEELKLSDLAPPYPVYQQDQNIQVQNIDISQLRSDQLQRLSIIKEEEIDESQLESQQFSQRHPQKQNSQHAINVQQNPYINEIRVYIAQHDLDKNQANTLTDNQFKMSQVSQSQSIINKIAEIDQKVKQVLSKSDKKLKE